MTDLRTDWQDNAGQVEDAAFLNQVGELMNANTHARPKTGPFADRPAASDVTSGALYFCSDNSSLYQSNGTNWVKVLIGGRSSDAMGDVPTTGWTAVNMQTGASWVSDKDGMVFTIPSMSTHPVQYQYRAYPTPPFALTVNMDGFIAGNNTPSSNTSAIGGICISDGTKFILFGQGLVVQTVGTSLSTQGSWATAVSEIPNYTANASTGKTWPINLLGGVPEWFRLSDNGTNLIYQYSFNGVDWLTLFSEARTAFLTPSRIGVGGSNFFGVDFLLRVRSWHGVA